MSADAVVVYCTVPDINTGKRIAAEVVEQQLAACVNILPSILSVYSWQDKIEEDQECLLLIKTTQVCYSKLEASLLALHPYDTPEVIAVPITTGAPDYLAWITKSTLGA